MSKENKVTEIEEVKAEETKKEPGAGEMVLTVPIRARSRDIEVLKYNFKKLTGKEYITAMDSDRSASNPFKITAQQAAMLFAMAAAHETEDVDAKDIMERMCVEDVIYASQLASLFFVTATSAATRRTAKG